MSIMDCVHENEDLLAKTPFSELLHTNYIPSAIDRLQLQKILEKPNAALSSLDRCIDDAQRSLSAMLHRRQQLYARIQSHQTLLSPLRFLPDEIWAEIFFHCLPQSHNTVMSVNQPPLTLGRVCVRWRNITCRTPRLWASLHISLPVLETSLSAQNISKTIEQVKETVKAHTDGVRRWISLSRSVPLSISIHPNDNSSKAKVALYRPYVDILRSVSHRIRRLEISVSLGDLLDPLLDLKEADLPMLSHLEILFTPQVILSAGTRKVSRWKSSGLLSAKSLRSLQLTQFPFHLPTFSQNWSHITHFSMRRNDIFMRSDITRLGIQDAYELFACCSRLIYCSIFISPSSRLFQEDASPICLASLETMKLMENEPMVFLLMQRLRLPALREVTYHNAFNNRVNRGYHPMVALLSQTNCHVETMTIDLYQFPREDLLASLELAPKLANFHHLQAPRGILHHRNQGSAKPLPINLSEALLRLLTPSGSDEEHSTSCPELRCLSIKGEPVSDVAVLQLVRCRLGDGLYPHLAKLRRVDVVAYRQAVDSPDSPTPLPLGEEELQLNMSYCSPSPPPTLSTRIFPYTGLLSSAWT